MINRKFLRMVIGAKTDGQCPGGTDLSDDDCLGAKIITFRKSKRSKSTKGERARESDRNPSGIINVFLIA